MRKTLTIFFASLVMVSALLGCQSTAMVERRSAPAPVVFVCEHGSVKSLISASLFNKIAEERGLPFRAVSRGLTPDASVPTKIVQALHGEGIEVETFKPTQLSSHDISAASRVIAIGVDLTPFDATASIPTERWDDLPASASADFAATRAAILGHIEATLNALQNER